MREPDDIELELAHEDSTALLHRDRLWSHPDCRDPEHPGCSRCRNDDDDRETNAYAEGRKDEREDWMKRVGPLMRELWEAKTLSEQQCAAYLDTDLVTCRRIIQGRNP